MKKQYRKATNIFIMLCMIITIASCNDDLIAPIPSTKVAFKLQKLNMGDDKSYSLKSSKIDARRSWWYEDNEGFIHLGKSIDLIAELNNGETVKVSIETSFREERKELLTLSAYDTINRNRSWDYKSSSDNALLISEGVFKGVIE